MAAPVVKQESVYREAFRSVQERTAGRNPAWLGRLRESAMDQFEQLGFPTVKDEEWKYTNVAPLTRLDLELQVNATTSLTAADVSRLGYKETEKSQLVFVNGVLRHDLSSLTALPESVVAIDLATALEDEESHGLVREHLARSADYNASGFIALNTALIASGAFVLIPTGIELETPLHLLFISAAANGASFPRVLIVAEENSGATIVESYVSANDGVYLTNAVVEVVLKDGARVEHYKVQRESAAAFHVASTQADLGPNSKYDATTVNFGGELSRHDVGVKMGHEGAECWVDGLYLVGSGQHTDTHSVIDHQQPHCTSHQLYKGILDGKSRAVFNGKIFVRHGAQKTDAMQTNKNLLLSNEARVDTKPQLEILADDVKCAHGAAVGQIEEDELFYLEARGIHTALARNLLTYGFAEEVIGKIKIDSIRAQLDEAVLNRLNARLEA
ncbi:MAG: Fe-S cluster assembly protein SufD [Acidobacteriota bacterium]